MLDCKVSQFNARMFYDIDENGKIKVVHYVEDNLTGDRVDVNSKYDGIGFFGVLEDVREHIRRARRIKKSYSAIIKYDLYTPTYAYSDYDKNEIILKHINRIARK